MRFFSNENRDSTPDDQDSTVQLRSDEPADATQSVPQQRTGSPWSAAPGDNDDNADAELATQEQADGSDEPGYAGDHRDGDAVDLPLDDHTNGSAPHSDVATATVDDENRINEPVAESSTTTTYGPDGTVSATPSEMTGDPAADRDFAENDQIIDTDTTGTDSAVSSESAASSESALPSESAASSGSATSDLDGNVEPALRDGGDFDDPALVDPTDDRPMAGSHAAGTDVPPAAGSVDTYSVPDNEELATDTNTVDDDEVAASDDTGTAPLDEAPADDVTGDDRSAPVVPIPVPVASSADTTTDDGVATGDVASTDDGVAPTGDKLPGSVAEPDLSSIFNSDDASSFHDRWRDVQLKFVDSPKDATTEAAGLVDEAVDKLAASLKDQKAKLHQVDSDDTEQLRVELRGYRDILNRVLGL